MAGIRAHYVPQFYLKNFGNQIYQYDKRTGKVNKAMPKNVAFQRDFYVDSDNDAALKLEGAMSQLEGDASAVISNIIENGSIAGLSNTDRAKLCEFVAFQFARTPEYRDWRHDTNQNLLDVLKRIGATDWRSVENEKDAKLSHLEAMLDYVKRVGPYFLQMRLGLSKNDTPIPLWTSDNPVVRYNILTDDLGAGSPGVWFNLPLTPKLLLSFYDGTDIDLLGDVARSAGIPEALWILVRDKTLEGGMEREHVIHANHLQTRFSTRFVFSNRPHFHMMKEFRKADGDYRHRHTFQTGWMDDQIHVDGSVIIGDGWECRDNLVGGVDPLHHNLDGALWRYRVAVRETDMRRAFVMFYDSLEWATNLSWPGDHGGEEFDDKVRKLLGDQTLPIDRLRRLHDCIERNECSDAHADMANMAEQIKTLRRIAAQMLSLRRDELQAVD